MLGRLARHSGRLATPTRPPPSLHRVSISLKVNSFKVFQILSWCGLSGWVGNFIGILAGIPVAGIL